MMPAQGLAGRLDSTIVRAICIVVALLPSFAAAKPVDLSPLEPTWAMRSWSQAWLAHEGRHLNELGRLRRLADLLTREPSLAIHEVSEPTPTAGEAFLSRRADCVGFALLLASLARSAGVPVEFALIAGVRSLDERRTLRIRREHLAVTYAGRVFDLGGETAFDPEHDRAVGERTATALFLSNRGAQRLTAGHLDDAVETLWRALRFDTSLPSIWTNLGVALRRAGDATGAVLAHEMALRIDPADEAALRNLAIARRDR